MVKKPRVFHSMGKGRSGGQQPRGWTADELYRRLFPSRTVSEQRKETPNVSKRKPQT
jgi:hypothetical protein